MVANMNAIVGVARPGDFGADMMHFNPHKTFSGPHGAGGPGAGPIAVSGRLAPYLPVPRVVYEGGVYRLEDDRPKSIGRVRSFFGNTGVLLRMYFYLLTHGPDGLRRVAENAVLNANYLLSRVEKFLPVPQGSRCMHEFVASARPAQGGAGYIGHGYRQAACWTMASMLPRSISPWIVREAMMFEPTETESRATLDALADTLACILQESTELLHDAPHSTEISRADEVQAARTPILKWQSK